MDETESVPVLTPRLLAIARGRACDLLGLTLLQGVRSERVPALRSLPGMETLIHLPFDEDAAGAEHYRVLERGAPPIESLFLGGDGLVGGDLAATVRQEMQADGVRITQGETPDHLGLQLAWLSHLLGAEADAHEDGRADLAIALQARQVRVLDHHILRFIQPFSEAVSQNRSPFYTALVDAIKLLLIDLRAQHSVPPEAWALAEPERPLAHPENRLRDIADWLCIPGHAGFYFSLDEIQRLGRELEVPAGFGRRVDCLESLLHGAVRFEALPRLLEALDSHLETLTGSRNAVGLPDAHRAPWSRRIQATRTGLATLARGAASLNPTDE